MPLDLSSAQYLEDMKESATMNDDELQSRPRKLKYNSIFMCEVEIVVDNNKNNNNTVDL